MSELRLFNTLRKEKQAFTPITPNHVGIYACGPTVYDRIHVGNARPLVLFDILVRLLRKQYKQVTYVRNITDVAGIVKNRIKHFFEHYKDMDKDKDNNNI